MENFVWIKFVCPLRSLIGAYEIALEEVKDGKNRAKILSYYRRSISSLQSLISIYLDTWSFNWSKGQLRTLKRLLFYDVLKRFVEVEKSTTASFVFSCFRDFEDSDLTF